MHSQSTPFHHRTDPRAHLLIGGATTCPTCDQDIPADKLKEISGRIAVRLREQEQGIRTSLEKRFEMERTHADAKAAAALQEERQQAAAHLESVREETRLVAETAAQEKLEAAERSRDELEAKLQMQVRHLETAHVAAQESNNILTAQIEQIRQEGAATLEAEKTAAAAREENIRKAVTQEAAATAAKQVEELSASYETQTAALRQQVEEAGRVQAGLKANFDESLLSKTAEIEKLKSDAIAAETRVRQEATVAAQAKADEQIAIRDQQLTEVMSRAKTAEDQLAKATEEFTTTLESQRQTLDKARDEAVSAEKAKAFEDNQKLLNRVSDLQRALDKKTNEELGEGAEVDLFESLKKEFPDDDIQRVAKGQPGADIIHKVMHNRIQCGVIVYDSKNHKAYRSDHVTKLQSDRLAVGADHAILSALKLPAGCRQIHLQDGVLIANPARVATLVQMLRLHIVQVHTLRISATERENKTMALYDFITSDRFRQITDRIDGDADLLLGLQEKEVKQHNVNWEKQGKLYRSIQKTTADLMQTVASIVGTAPPAVELEEIEDKTADIFQ